ncbi:M81 family metallopeptidase [Brachybacterium sp. p3-SID1565]|uniref:M81 family metallopeptidase n=1 Tax=Brachybacterium epidermidis TaxID=2781983 RepID=A0ABR9VYD6_9MICO|nr:MULTISPECIES: M81 family metallopeptidase [Brachybacterium]MBE9403204.1 M81 family metallopeptidase [Brachybacterium epidermidis]MCT1385838.1 M81 family metallopeptidase [Brachybacterium sp. p3-SID1565]
MNRRTEPHRSEPRRPRIGIAGIAIESSTFTPYRSSAEDFEVRRGTEQILDRYPFFTGGSASGKALREAADYVGVLHARALPGGQLVREVYEGWTQEICEGLAAAHAERPLDGFYFDIHGAMSVEGLEDAEGDLISAIREVIGPDVVVGTAMDLHGNVSETLFDACDLLTCYRHAPHIDAWETRERGLRDLVDATTAVMAGGPLPHKALVHVPVLLPGEKTSTRIEPARSIYGRIPELTAREGVTDVSYWVGFAWADQHRCKAAIVAFGADADAVDAAALELATAVWEARHDFEFVAPTGSFADCLDQAIASEKRPFWISDSGDNPGAGGADDTTHCLAQLLEREEIRAGQVSALMVSLVDPESAQAAWEMGVGGRGDLLVGGRIDAREPGPVPLRAEVVALDDSPATGRAAALRVLVPAAPGASGSSDDIEGSTSRARQGAGAEQLSGLTVVVTARRSQFATADMFARLGLSMTGFDVVTVKMGYLEPDQYEAAADWLLALTPGGVDQDLVRLGHSRIDRPMIPFDADIPAPSARRVRQDYRS